MDSESQTERPFKIDTGADCRCICSNTYNGYIKSVLVNSSTTISSIAMPIVKPTGNVYITVMYKNKA